MASLNDYVIKKRLAQALFGDVLLCEHKATQEQVAVKRVLLSAAASKRTLVSKKKVRENVALERQLYRVLRKAGGHSNVLAMRDEIECDGYLYMMFDYCARGELYDIVSSAPESRLDAATIKTYMRQIASGVKFLHDQGYAHRDLSLENVLVTSDNECKVCDFGLAAPIGVESKETVGKMFYMAPEVLAGLPYDPVKADIWSLGVMLFIMFAGAPPVESASTSDPRFRLIASKGVRHLIQRWGITDQIPAAAIDLIAQMMHVDPNARISIEDVLSHPFVCPVLTTRTSSMKLKERRALAGLTTQDEATAESSSRSGSSLASALQRLFRRSKRVMACPTAVDAHKTAIAA